MNGNKQKTIKNMDAHSVFSQFQDVLIEIRFMEGTNSYEKYGSPVAGFLSHHFGDKDGYIDYTIPHSINISKGEMGGFSMGRRQSKLLLTVIAGCQANYNISEKNVKLLKEEGFSVYDIEENGINQIS